VWLFNTATGTNQELISAPADEGLHALVQHEVNFQHDHGEVHMPFQATVGSANVSPDHVDTTVTGDSGSFDVTFKSGIDLDGLEAAAFASASRRSPPRRHTRTTPTTRRPPA
jgi:hypothetical protein